MTFDDLVECLALCAHCDCENCLADKITGGCAAVHTEAVRYLLRLGLVADRLAELADAAKGTERAIYVAMLAAITGESEGIS